MRRAAIFGAGTLAALVAQGLPEGSAAAADPASAPTAPSAASAGTAPSTASALQPTYDVLLPDPEPVEAKASGKPEEPSGADVDVADRVLSAAKQVTTVQEAPAIITVIRSDEIQARGYRTLSHVLETVPGWLNASNLGQHLTMPLVRGTAQAALLLRDGVSLFEPTLNAAQFTRAQALETLKAVEVVTGPGGVLWGANSFLGIINLVSKDADDINGLEASAGYGDGPGGPQDFRAYLLFGKSFRFKKAPTIGVVLHTSFETYLPPRFTRALTLLRSASPAPPGPHVYTITADSNPSRSWIVNLDGKLSIGPVTISWAAPFAVLNNALTFDFTVASGQYDPLTMAPTGEPVNNSVTILDRFVTIQYKSRFLKDRIGLDAKLYGMQFVRGLDAVLVSGNPRTNGPVTMRTDPTSYRLGFSIDGDAVLPLRNRLLFGGDVFHERVPTTDAHFFFIEPQFLNLPCPQTPDSTQAMPKFVEECPQQFVNGADRTVAALYLSDQFRPHPRLTLDGGVRLQGGFGKRGYQNGIAGSPIVALGSASVVWNFYSDMNLKANYSSGFRPPVFNNTDSNGRSIQFGGNPKLANEESQSFQGEFNARLLKNIGPIRQLQLRVDYAYTDLKSLIVIANGRYTNQRTDSRDPNERSQRHIHSVESSARMFLSDHTLSVGYTFMDVTTNDRGRLRNLPQHWFTLGWVLGIMPRYFDLNGTLLVTSSYDDPNRLTSVTSPATPATMTSAAMPETRIGQYADVAFDRIGPQALLNLGVRTRLLKNRFWASLNFYNVLNQKGAFPDPFYDLAPTLEVAPNPRPEWSMFLQLGGKPF